ncbi:MAG: alpha/beta fold hydrolase, partial [Chloroflexota bacterium]
TVKERNMARIESLLAARLFLKPQLVGNRIYFLSNLSGKISLYVMDHGGSVPEPLLPPNIALQNPHLIGGKSFYVLPDLGKIVVMVDEDGDENYQPMVIPLAGGFPEPAFGDAFDDKRIHLGKCDLKMNLLYLMGDARAEAMNFGFQANLETGEVTEMGRSEWGAWISGVNQGHDKAILIEGYSVGDNVVRLWEKGKEGLKLLYGVPMEERKEGQEVPINTIEACEFMADDKGLLFSTSLFEDTYGLGYFELDNPQDVKELKVSGQVHEGIGEFAGLEHLAENRYLMYYNIDGSDWVYVGEFDEGKLEMKLGQVLIGQGEFANGVIEAFDFDEAGNRFAVSFSSAVSPTQIYSLEGANYASVIKHTAERILGIPEEHLSAGEDASYESFDGLRISARLYMPADALGYQGPRPLAFYVHGGPQGQERPDFAWFSMPIIQFLTVKGFAVFVPNVRGSTGYGSSYMKKVDRDWGGDDRLDHVHAMTEVLPKDKRIDVKRAGVVGRSYGGYMSLTLAGRHPELWSAAIDMFGPYDLYTFMDRIPESWKPYFKIAVGDPEKDKEMLTDRSPKTHLENMTCPMLVIQGKNDPRVVEKESADLVEELRGKGKQMEYLMFEDEGHDVLKYDNRVRCYNAITEFFEKHLVD